MKLQKPGSKKTCKIKILGIAVLFLGTAILFFGCENDIQQIKAFSNTEDLPIVEANDFETLFTDSGVVRFSLKTPRLLQFENEGKEYVEFPEGMQFIKYEADKSIIFNITSDYARQYVKEQKWEAKNNVVAINQIGDTLRTEHLIYDEKDEKIYTEEFVKIIRKDEVYTGIGLTADQSMVKWRIKKLKGIAYVTVDDQNDNKGKPKKTSSDLKNSKDKPFDGPLQFDQ